VSRFWIFAADPTRYHWDTLFVKGKELWDGIRNLASQRYLKQVHKGDRIMCYHGAPARSVYALAVAASDPYPHPDERQKKFLVIDLKAVERLPRGPLAAPLGELPAFAPAFSMVEGWRGAIIHWVMAGADGRLWRVKILDPSFLNWRPLSYALLKNIVPDFPLCNKSFNQSYSGNDL